MAMTVTTMVEIAADPGEVWAVLADLTATRWWLPGVVEVRLDGDVRVCTMADGQEIHERISGLSPDGRSFRFGQLRVGLPVRRSGGVFEVTDGAGASTARVALQVKFEPLDRAAGEQLAGMIEQVFGQS